MSFKHYTLSKYVYCIHSLFRIEKKNEYGHKKRTYHPKSGRLVFILCIIHEDCKCLSQTDIFDAANVRCIPGIYLLAKRSPVTGLEWPDGSRKLRFPYFTITAQEYQEMLPVLLEAESTPGP